DERPAHLVTLSGFRAAIAPVTNAQYAAYCEATGAAPAPFLSDERFADPGQPAVGISHVEAIAFCEWLTLVTGVPFRLPTEAEREYAALGGLAGGLWPWTTPPQALLTAINAMDRPHPPAARCANGYGLQCMVDNVHEWCSDWYARDYYAESPAANPAGPGSGKRRASRGGSWRHSEKFTAVSARSSLDPSFHYSDFGFRVYASL
ncbi:MAG: formylglycine-generating enzyme family protein, partial [Dehalococcoidia bacterium]